MWLPVLEPKLATEHAPPHDLCPYPTSWARHQKKINAKAPRAHGCTSLHFQLVSKTLATTGETSGAPAATTQQAAIHARSTGEGSTDFTPLVLGWAR